MTASTATRLGEFSVGTGSGVLVDRRGKHNYIHVDQDCASLTKNHVGIYPTEKTARAALPHVKACKTCRS